MYGCKWIGVNGNLLALMESFLFASQQWVVLDGQESLWLLVHWVHWFMYIYIYIYLCVCVCVCVCVRIFTRLTLYLHSFSIFMFVAATIILIIFWDFPMLSKFPFHYKWNEAWLFFKNCYMRVVSRVAERS